MTLPIPNKCPSPATLKKYGLSLDEWIKLYWKYGGRCHCCFIKFGEGKRTYIDHEHVKNYEKLPDDVRKSKVRGILDYQCNFILLQKTNDDRRKLKNGMRYLERYESAGHTL